MALVERAGRFDVRSLLLAAEGTLLGQPVMEADRTQRLMLFAKLERLAYGDSDGV